MSLTETTILALVLSLILLFRGPERGLWALMISLPFGVAAAVNLPALGNSSLLMADLVALTLVALTVSRLLIAQEGMTLRLPAFAWWLIAMMVFCVFITFFGPRLYANQIDVFTIGRTASDEFIVRTTLQPSSKNISQLMRFGISLSVGLAIILASPQKFQRALPGAFVAMTITHLTLSAADYITFAINRPEWLEFIRNANYTVLYKHQIEGIKRVIGGFAEASAAGNFSLSLFGFWMIYWIRGGRAKLGGYLAIGSLVTVLASGSSAAFVAVALFTALTAISLFLTKGRVMGKRRNWLLITAGAVLPAIVLGAFILSQTNPSFGAYFDRLIFSKLESHSAVERMMWNRHALDATLESSLLGLGLGSIRSSNFLIACLSTLGFVGSFIYFGMLTSLAIGRPRGTQDSERAILAHACRAACLALFCKAIVTKSSPDLEIIFFLCASAAMLLRDPVAIQAHEPLPSGSAMRRKTMQVF